MVKSPISIPAVIASAFLAVAGLMAAWPARASACDVPVFRYALESFGSDPYRVLVFHRGPLGAEDLAAVNILTGAAEKQGANLWLKTVDLAGEVDQEIRELWSAQSDAVLPWMIVWLPWSRPEAEVLWTGPLSEASTRALVASPKRSEIARRILTGDTAVWVLLECGGAAKDSQAAGVLENNLDRLAKTYGAFIREQMIATGLDEKEAEAFPIRFSILRVSRADPAEQRLVAMLLGCETGLEEYPDEPMVFPVFGRGRALCALVGKGVNAENFQEVCAFLLGPCTCYVKDAFPGLDLLLSVDWDAGLTRRYTDDIVAAPLTGLPTTETPEPTEEASPPQPAPPNPPGGEYKEPPSASPLLRNSLLAAGFIIVGVGVAVLVLRRRRNAPRN